MAGFARGDKGGVGGVGSGAFEVRRGLDFLGYVGCGVSCAGGRSVI